MSETDYIEKVLSTLAYGQTPRAADVTAALDQRRREKAQRPARVSAQFENPAMPAHPGLFDWLRWR